MPTISTACRPLALGLFAWATALGVPALAQEKDVENRIAQSDSSVGVAPPSPPDGAAPPDPSAPAAADVAPGDRVLVEIETEADAPADARETVDSAAPSEGGSDAPVDLTAQEVPLSAIVGLAVRGADGSERGTVDDVIVSLETGRIVAMVIGSGGLLGLGGETERVGVEDVSIDALGGAVVLSDGGAE